MKTKFNIFGKRNLCTSVYSITLHYKTGIQNAIKIRFKTWTEFLKSNLNNSS